MKGRRSRGSATWTQKVSVPTRVAAAAPHPKPLNSAKLSSLSPMPNAACALVTASATCGRAFGAATSTNRSV